MAQQTEIKAERPAWFCVQTQPKHEHVAAAHLQKAAHFEVYLPRIRFKRSTPDGPAWFTEALFPGYVFARFALATSGRLVHHAPGVRGIVHFGDQWPAIPDGVVDELRAAVGAQQVHVVSDDMHPGDKVTISGGVFHNLQAVVMRVMPGRDRVAVLLDFLGRQTAVELAGDSLVREEALAARRGRSA